MQQALADNLLTPRNDAVMDRTGGRLPTPQRHQGGICFETKFGTP